MPIISVPSLPFLVAARFYDLASRVTGRDSNADMYRTIRRVTNHIVFSAPRISQDLGWQSRVSLDEALKASLEVGTDV
jgi:nucleoside-diphosphate-sugar epimerase